MTLSPTGPLALSPDAQELLFTSARTANTFTDETITDEQIAAIYELVKWAPTSLNTQPLRIVLVRSPQARERLVAHMYDNNKEKTATAPLTAIVAADTEFHDELPKLMPHFPGARELFGDAGMRERTARFNGALQVGYFILGIRAAGLAAGPMSGFDAAGVDAEFFPDGIHKTLAIINIGHPGENAWWGRSPRLDYTDVVSTV
jgi:3-hydroxypropanoate dehydrogenase